MQMNMIPANMTIKNCNIAGLTSLTDYLPGSKSHFSFQNMITIFRNPYEMILDIIDRVRPLAIFFAYGDNLP